MESRSGIGGGRTMTVIAHLSDLHFGFERQRVLEALLDDLAASPPDLVVISGDLTQTASHSEYRAARLFLDRLPAPLLIVPGNHDITPYRPIERMVAPFRRWRRFVTEGLAPEWADESVVVKGINSARPFGPYLNWSRGQFSARQIEAVNLMQIERRMLVVVAHHPLAFGDDIERRFDLTTGAEAMLDAMSRRGRGIILLGHRHRSHISLWSPATGERAAVETVEMAASDVVVVHAGTAISDRLRGEPNAWNRLTFEGGSVVVDTRHFSGLAWEPAARIALTWPGEEAASACSAPAAGLSAALEGGGGGG
jgi:3',5'-cyclic AMP phosphodiesterase CpdA